MKTRQIVQEDNDADIRYLHKNKRCLTAVWQFTAIGRKKMFVSQLLTFTSSSASLNMHENEWSECVLLPPFLRTG